MEIETIKLIGAIVGIVFFFLAWKMTVKSKRNKSVSVEEHMAGLKIKWTNDSLLRAICNKI